MCTDKSLTIKVTNKNTLYTSSEIKQTYIIIGDVIMRHTITLDSSFKMSKCMSHEQLYMSTEKSLTSTVKSRTSTHET